MIFILLLSSLLAYAEAPLHWAHVLEVNDKHEFYQNHETIIKPQDSWQTLFSLVYVDKDLKRLKDCVFYRVPGKEQGALKIKTMNSVEKCDEEILNPGDTEVLGVRTLQYSIYDRRVNIDLSLENFKVQSWEATLQGAFVRPKASMGMSSAEYKSPKIIYLAPKSSVKQVKEGTLLKDKKLCHDVNESCQETAKSECSSCENGWYEVPNGCASGPKYCGTLQCGSKDQPACRRGMKWQKSEKDFDCRTDSSYAYCSSGFKVTCEGQKAFCR